MKYIGLTTFELTAALLVAVLVLEPSTAEPKVFYLQLLGDVGSLQEASLNYAIDEANAHTSAMSGNPFSLKIANASQNRHLYQEAAALLQQDVVALIEGNHSSDRACVLSMFTQIPLLRHYGNRGDWDECQDVGVSLPASPDSYARATAELLETFHWSEITILYEESFIKPAHHFESFVHHGETTVRLQKLYQLPNETIGASVTRTAKQMSSHNARVVLLYAGEVYQRKLLAEVRCGPKRPHVWILQGEIPANVTKQPHDKVIGFRLLREKGDTWKDYETRFRPLLSLQDDVVLKHDAGRVIAQALTDMANSNDWVRMVNETSQYAPLSNRMLFLEHLKKARVQGITGRVQFDKNGLRDDPALDLINLENDLPVKVGSWRSGKLTLTKDLGNDPGSLEGRRLRVVTVEATPYITSSNGTNYEGFCVDVLLRLAKDLKFTYEIKPSSDGKYGALVDGAWDGMIGDLVRKEADMAVAALYVSKDRETVVDFTVACMPTSTDMILKKEYVEKVDYLQFMTPLQVPVWLMVLVCQLVVTAAVFTLNYYSPYGYKDEEGKGTSSEFNVFNSLWFSLACLLQQGGDNTPKATSGRLLTGCYWFCVLVLVSTYTANLAAFLAFKDQRLPVRNLEEALEADYEIGVAASSANSEFFRKSKSPLYQKIWNRINSRNSFAPSLYEGVKRARNGKYVYVEDGPFLEYMAGKEPCDLITLPALTKNDAVAFALQENDSNVDEINLALLRLRENGHLDRLRRKWWLGTNQCTEPTVVANGTRVTLEMMSGVYIVLAAGLLVSFVALGVEIMWHKRKQKKLRQPDKEEENGKDAYDLPVIDT